jgi:hypothetical protein
MRTAITLALAGLLAGVSGARAGTPDDAWRDALGRYVQDPAGNRAALLVLGRHADGDLPPLYRVALADANLRAGHLKKAGRLFEDVMSDDAGEPWTSIAAVGRGWVAVSRGRMDEARDYFADASTASGSTGLLADFMVGMIDAERGDPTALDRFARVANDPDVPDGLKSAASMADGYARFWMGDDAGAGDAFARIADDETGSPMADEARYAAALVQWRSGDRDGAESALRELASAGSRNPSQRQPAGLVKLDPRGMVRASARRYRRLPLRMPADQVLQMLKADVPSLARVALRRIEAGEAAPGPLTHRRALRPRADDGPTSETPSRSAEQRAGVVLGRGAARGAGSATLLGMVPVGTGACLLMLAWSLVRLSRRSRSGR